MVRALMEFRSWYATCPRGAEPALQGELSLLGAKGIRPGAGGVRFTGQRELALRACLSLRTALRVLEPLGEFEAPSAAALYEGARALPWPELIAPGQTIAVSAGGSAPGLTHTHFVALKIKDAIVDAVRDARGARPSVDAQRPDVLVVAHLGQGKCQLSLDLAGDLLSNRGYRVRTVKAPLRESLAAAVILMSGWDRARPLHDPLCGAGTLAIEAALLAAERAPNAQQPLSCERWPRTASEVGPALRRLREELEQRAQERLRAGVPPILASDRDEEAVQATQANARAAGVASLVRVFQRDARELQPLDPPGQLVMNPPYGERLEAGGRKPLKTFFHALGQAVRKLPAHRLAALAGSEDFESAFGLRPRARLKLWNGPLECRLLLYETGSGDRPLPP
jgi:putative N6-adenine-specific DNA methylase